MREIVGVKLINSGEWFFVGKYYNHFSELLRVTSIKRDTNSNNIYIVHLSNGMKVEIYSSECYVYYDKIATSNEQRATSNEQRATMKLVKTA